ncbi:hypothetical protein FD13_GL001493 [Levilactobacillus senmaizukei DSM 21775 = NBRC 103853]|uniref:GIY-YIG domain-containing protein n=1 Tax=Levilactobacillus senmaizukei DSM 21775 = NBRC 103853 TaxID=1423803 RepID=A0A0R2DGN6_9LACO|nr:hypothetical protein FD13_GL001493 [Levilactobacillus senmaizukei DSM 21775 = NBRC 103853]
MAGKGAKYTRVHRPVKVLFSQGFDNKHDALHAEWAFKHQTRRRKLVFLADHGVRLPE